MNHKKSLILQLIVVIGLCFAALGFLVENNGTQAAVNGVQPLLGTQSQRLINSREKPDFRQFQEPIIAQEYEEYTFVSTFIPPPSLDFTNFPYDLAFDQDNNLYMIPWTGTTVKKYNLQGELLAEWGGHGEEYGDYEFYAITGIAVDINNNVYVVDYAQACVKKFDSNGNFLLEWGQSGDGEGQFDWPEGITISHDGFIYVADKFNNRIQKFDSNGNFILEWGESGDGEGQFDWPGGITISHDGFIYVADTYNNRIQKFDSNGNFILEWGESGDGEGQFNYPEGITVSQDGFVFVADTENKRIQKFDSSGSFILEWESGQHGRVISPTKPRKLAIDKEGFIFVADGGTGFLEGHDQLQKFDLNGNFISEWGRGSYGSRYPIFTYFDDYGYPDYTLDSHGTFYENWAYGDVFRIDFLEQYPGGNEEEDMAVDKNGNVWVIDPNTPGVEKYTSDGYYVTQWLSYQLPDSIPNWPLAVAKDQYGYIYIVDCYLKIHYDRFGNPYFYEEFYRIKKFDETGGLITSWEKTVPWIAGYSNVSLAVDNEGYVYLALRDQNEIYKFNSDGTFLIAWDCHNPAGMAVDLDGHIYVSDVSNHLIEKYDTQGTLLDSWGNEGGEDGEFQSPQRLSVDVDGFVYVADSGNHRIQKFDSDGNFITKWGSEGDGELEFSNPHSLAVDDEGFVYVIDTGNDRRIQKFKMLGGVIPGAFGKTTPADGAVDQPLNPTLFWEVSESADYYEYCIDTNNNDQCDTSWFDVGNQNSIQLIDLSDGTGYYWQVRAVNQTGNTYADDGSWWAFSTVGGVIPGAFGKTTPADGAVDQPLNPTLSWEVSEGADYYEYCIDTNNNDQCDTSWSDVGNQDSIQLSDLSDGTGYYWQVRAVNQAGNTYANDGSWWAFSTGGGVIPGAFGKTTPTDGAVDQPLNPTLSWEVSEGADYYEYCIDTNNNDQCDTSWSDVGNQDLIQLSDLSDGTGYYWQVRAVNQTGNTYADDGTWWSFTTVAEVIPDAFGKTSPTDGAVDQPLNPTLSWEVFEESRYYEYCIDTSDDDDCDGNWVEVWEDQSVTLDELETGTTYYWQVRAVDWTMITYADDGTWWSFTTVAEVIPDAFGKTSPTDAAVDQSLSPTLSWEESQHADHYEYCVDTSDDDACDGSWVSAGADRSVALDQLETNTSYYWQVRAVNQLGSTYADDGSWWSFTTVFGKIAPVDGAVDQPLSPTLSWEARETGHYNYCIDTSNDDACDGEWVFVGLDQSVMIDELDPNTTYYWQVQWKEGVGTTPYTYADDGTWWSFTTVAEVIPYAFGKTSPTDGAVDQSLSPTLSWEESQHADHYEYCVDTSDDDACDGDWMSVGADQSVTLDQLETNTSYYWQVRAVNQLGSTYADDGSWWSFKTVFGKIAPADGAVAQPLTPTLSWEAKEGANYYYYCIDTSDDDDCDGSWVSVGADQSVTLDELETGTTYYWQIRATINFGTNYIYADDGTWWSFKTFAEVIPDAFGKTSPTDGAVDQSLSPTLSWESSSDATSYEYCVDTSNDDICSEWMDNGNNTSKALSGLTAGTTYYWQVRAVNAEGTTYANGSETAFWSFTTSESVSVMMTLVPQQSFVSLGEVFDVVIEIQATDQLVDGASAYLNFDPTKLQVVSITPGTSLPTQIQNQYDNLAGHIDYSYGAFSDFPSGTFTLATVTFEAVAMTDSTLVSFNSEPPRNSDVTYGGYSILGSTQDGFVEISDNAELDGSVILEGRPPVPHSSWSIPLEVSLTLVGETTPLYTFSPTTDEYGAFNLSDIVPDTYNVTVKNSHTLQNCQEVSLSTGLNTVAFGVLREGDSNDDNCVTMVDFSILVVTFGICEGDVGFDPRADFNEDGCVNIVDFSLLRPNFGNCGDCQTTALPISSQLPGLREDVSISILPTESSVNNGDQFTVSIQISSGVQPIDGAAAYINFDPTKLQVVSITPGTSLPTQIQNQYDNLAGDIDYAYGTFSNFPSGTFELMEVTFEAIDGAEETLLQFNTVMPRLTDVTYGGGSVLTGSTGGSVSISEGYKIYLPLIMGNFQDLGQSENNADINSSFEVAQNLLSQVFRSVVDYIYLEVKRWMI